MHEVEAVRVAKRQQLSGSESLIEWRSTFEGGKGARHFIRDLTPSVHTTTTEVALNHYLGPIA